MIEGFITATQEGVRVEGTMSEIRDCKIMVVGMSDTKFDERIERTDDELKSQLDEEALSRFREPEQYALKKAMQLCGMTSLPIPLGDGLRCSGECLCKHCEKMFFCHPEEWRHVGYGGYPFLNILCDGTLVKRGEKVERLATIRIVDVRREPLWCITSDDVLREGFPLMTRREFITMFCEHNRGCTIPRT